MATNLPSCFLIQFLEQLLTFLVNFILLKYIKSRRSYGFLISKELIFGFQILDLNQKSKTSSNQRASAIIRLCDLMQKPPRLPLIRCNSLPKASKDTKVFRVTILIQNTSMRSISLLRIIMNIFILLKTPMITDRTWMMIMILWLMLTLILSLR